MVGIVKTMVMAHCVVANLAPTKMEVVILPMAAILKRNAEEGIDD